MAECSSVQCPMCDFEAPSIRQCLNHLRLVHSNDPRFCAQCGIGGCSYTGRSFSALYSHIYRRHPESGVIRKRDRPRIDVEIGIVGEEDSELLEQQARPLTPPELQGRYSYMYRVGIASYINASDFCNLNVYPIGYSYLHVAVAMSYLASDSGYFLVMNLRL